MGDGGDELELLLVMLWRDSDFLSLCDFSVSWSDETLLSKGLGERGNDEG
jgi:hypothetical protein